MSDQPPQYSVDRTQLEATLLKCLPAVEQLSHSLCRRSGFTPDEAEEFLSIARLRLVEDDYAVLRKFRGESSLTTYLAVVLAMLVREFRVKTWGRWRPSAEAKRRGDLALRLESLIYRSRYTIKEAGEILRSAGVTSLTDGDLSRLLRELPRRNSLRPVVVGEEALAETSSGHVADAALLDELRTHEQENARAALVAALGRLSPEDQLIIRMRFWERMSVADIARTLRRDQKPLYKRIDRLLAELRASLEAAGILPEQARSVFAELPEP